MSVIPLVEHFPSLQGEGYHTGRLAHFVRFSGCNLDCVFDDGSICDTPWQKARVKVEVQDVIAEAVDATRLPDALKRKRRDRPMLVLTGGEPTIARGFDELVLAGMDAGFYVAVETNGTTWCDVLEEVDWITVSPKIDTNHAGDQDPTLDSKVVAAAHEFRWVISEKSKRPPMWDPGAMYYLSPAMEADGLGEEHTLDHPPGFAPGALLRCFEIIQSDPRWRLSLQTHKWIGVR